MPLGEILLVLAIYVLVAARVTRSINYDTLLDPMRLWIATRASRAHAEATSLTTDDPATVKLQMSAARRYNRWNTLSDFLACPWCVGFWASVALAPIAIAVIGWPWWTLAVLPFAASHLIGVQDRWVSDPFEIEEK